MKETLDWDVNFARVIVRNKSKEATKRAFVKCTARPAADTIEVGGKMVVLRAQAEKEKDVDQQQEGFFAGLKKEEAARAVLKEKEPTQSMKDFAIRALSVTAFRTTMRRWRRKARQEVEVSKSTKRHHFKSHWPNLLSRN